jgi:(S)-2-hydroxyglutarate dehydrogenase
VTNRIDYVVIGGGIVGLTIALELKKRYPARSVWVLEKEARTGQHASLRNSGVIHSGIYYPPESVKARVCVAGARELAAYCRAHDLPLLHCGKLLVPTRLEDVPQLRLLAERAEANGVPFEKLNERQLALLEPEVRSATGEALLVRSTAVASPKAVLEHVTRDACQAGVKIHCGGRLGAVDSAQRRLRWNGAWLPYAHVLNAAGLHADTIAHRFGAGTRYVLLPFKGLYWRLDPASGIKVTRLVYPVPDLRVPFLGIHTTNSTDGATYLGPTAVPVFGRESYRGIQGAHPVEALRIGAQLLQQFVAGRDGFRRLALQEGRRRFKPWFVAAARELLPRLQPEHLQVCDKVGIRAQLLDRVSGRLVMDFLVERGHASTHVLNAISPAWTSAFVFARYVADNYLPED